ncbi:MAG: ABC transporter ATP-binding protein [Planctomycetota bacterium]|nr:ABC transporter ATP-binding protein [Planctomycetota bacterium]
MSDTNAANPLVSARGLCKGYGKGRARVEVLRGLDLHVNKGEFLAVMGPSGCGKSTLLHVLGLMTAPDAGSVCFDGVAAPARAGGRTAIRRDRIGFVFQRFNLIGVLSARANVAISLRVRGRRDDGLAGELFERLGLSEVAARKPGQLSIGEQQRVAVVRALAHRPDLLLADEPTGNLDSANATGLLDVFREINRQGQTIVMITHSPEAAQAAGRIVCMRDGKLFDHNP